MKKIAALLAIVAMVSCGTATSTEVLTDSTATVGDSSVVLTDTTTVAVDSTKSVDSVKAK